MKHLIITVFKADVSPNNIQGALAMTMEITKAKKAHRDRIKEIGGIGTKDKFVGKKDGFCCVVSEVETEGVS